MDIILKMQLNVLIHLAKVDGEISSSEREMLEQISGNHGVSGEELDHMIQYPKPMESLGALSNDLKFDYLYSIVQLMNVDGEIDDRELHFCQNLALRLGYYKEVIEALWEEIISDKDLQHDKEALKRIVQRFNPYI